jgi:hypothetical protein
MTTIKPGDLVMLPRNGRIVRVEHVDHLTDKHGRAFDMLTIARIPFNEDDHCDPHSSIDAAAVTLVTPNTNTPIVPHDSSDGMQ